MKRHITRTRLNAYLDKTLTADERREVYMHVRECALCDAKLRSEESLRTNMRQIGSITPQRRDFSTMLPGILAEAQTPAHYHINKTAIVLAILVAIVLLVPLVRNTDLTSLAPDDNSILNVPIATHTLTIQERATYENENLITAKRTPVSEVSDSTDVLQVSINVEYASPVPPPRATRIASVEPPR